MASTNSLPRKRINEATSSLFLSAILLASLEPSSSSFASADASFRCRLCNCQQQLFCSNRKTSAIGRDRSQLIYKTSRRHFYPSNFITNSPCYSPANLYSSISNGNEDDRDELERILRRYGFGSRLVTLTDADLSERPVPAEIYEGGRSKLGLVLGLKPPSSWSSSSGDGKPPLLDVVAMDDNGLLRQRKVVDIGQITTLWQDISKIKPSAYTSLDALTDSLQSNFGEAEESLRNNMFPVEKAMQNLYNGRIANRSRPPSHSNRHALTKKQIPKIASRFSNPPRLEDLLRSLLKVGEDRLSRLVDSAMAADYLYSDYCRDGDDEVAIRRMVAARVLWEDAASGGRFKRRSCQFVSARYCETSNAENEVTLVNGGWIAVDPSVRAGAEGRKFAATTMATGNASEEDKVRNECNGRLVLTAADERIAHRLECLAMGDSWRSSEEDRRGDEDEKALELDVREALSSMNLPLTPQGAQSALVKIGRWSAGTDDDAKGKQRNGAIEPWSPDLLDAARSLARYESNRRDSLAKNCFASSKKKGHKKAHASPTDGLEGRVDLTSLPCVCVDAKRATFRDDSVGIRLRSSTGRRVNKSASKWEVLVHIADVSDIYFDERKFDANVFVPSEKDVNTSLLREAAERRGQSRYDLPLGPLHLLPPVALSALSLATNKDTSPNRCVTLWAYIDERDGKLLEVGLERTIISSPTALSFADATTLLESSADEVPKSMSNSKAIIAVAERSLSLWSQHHRQRSRSAQKREERFATKELISKELSAVAGTRTRDDGVGGSFQRSRGHRMVDSSLDLYAFAVGTLMSRAKRPIPRAAGSGADRGGRLGTAPLRRYIDGVAQRQALSVLCGYGEPLTLEECLKASKVAARARDNIANVRSSKQSPTMRNGSGNRQRQVSALHELARHLASTGGIQNRRRVKAVSTGHNNEVVILGAGATARCKGVRGTLKSGEKLLVQVDKIDPEVGVLDVSLV